MADNNKLRGILIAVAVVLIGSVATAATILISRNIARARRLQEIYVEIDLPVAPEVAALVAEALREEATSLDEGSTVFVSTAQNEADQNGPVDESESEAETRDTADEGSPAPSQHDAETDVRITEVPAGFRDADTSGQPAPDPSTYFAVDPYVLLVDQRLGASILNADLTLQTLTDVLATLEGGDNVPLIVAGDERTEFATFLLYLAGELLSQDAFEKVLGALENWSADPDSSADTEELLATFEPVVAELQQWRDRGILVFNWTDWDDIAVRQAILDGRAATVFRRRSEVFNTAYSQAFFLRIQRLPVGVGKRSFRLWGRALAVVPGEGPRAAAAFSVEELLRSGPIQVSIERQTSYSPVLLDGSPLNRDHRDVVRWYQSAEDLIVIDDRIAAHPVFQRLHIQLR